MLCMSFVYVEEKGKKLLVKETRYFDSDHLITSTSINIIKGFITKLFQDFLVDLEGAKLISSSFFDHFEHINQKLKQ